MCNFVSGIITIKDKQILTALGGMSHSAIRDHYGIPDNELVEWEWELDKDLVIRVKDNRAGDGVKEPEQCWRAYFLSQFPNRNALLARFGKKLRAHWLKHVQHSGSLGYVPSELQDRDMCFEAMRHGRWLGHVPPKLRDREMCFEYVKHGGRLGHVPPKLRDEVKALMEEAGNDIRL